MGRPRKAGVVWPPKLPANCPLTLRPDGYQGRVGGKSKFIAGKVPLKEALRIYHDKAGAALRDAPKPVPQRAPEAAADAGKPKTVHVVLARWLKMRQEDAGRGKLGGGTYGSYERSLDVAGALVGHVVTDDWTPDTTRFLYDELERRHSANFAKTTLERVRWAFRHAADHDWCRPIRLGSLRRLVGRGPARMKWTLYTPQQVRTILAELDRLIAKGDGRRLPTLHQLRAMVYLTLNGGFGSAELSELTKAQVDVAGALLTHKRGKTGAEHVCPLWPETVEALKPVLAQRPGDPLLFRTREGNPWYRVTPTLRGGRVANGSHHDNYLFQWDQLVKPLGLKIAGQGPYKLKALGNSTADAAGDHVATYVLFGHSEGVRTLGVKAHYLRVDVERLRRVTDYARGVLLGHNKTSSGSAGS